MPDINLHLGKIQGRVLQRSDIRVGCFADFPSGLGGSLEYKCTELTDKFACFTVKPGYKDIPHWLKRVVVQFDVPDFTAEEWQALGNGMKDSFLDADRSVLHKAGEYGYILIHSYTQYQWTRYGIDEYQKWEKTAAAMTSCE